MKRATRIFLFLLLATSLWNCRAKRIPNNYDVLFEENFERRASVNKLYTTDPNAWRIIEDGKNKALELHQMSSYEPRVRSPKNIALIKNKLFGDFVLEVELAQTGREYGHRDMCIFFGVKDPANFYYTHIATAADPNAHNIFLVNDEPRRNIASKTTKGVDWGKPGEWHKIRIERKLTDGTIRVFFDDMKNPIMEATDNHFEYGYIGFGSFDDTGKIDNIKIYGPGFVPVKKEFFR